MNPPLFSNIATINPPAALNSIIPVLETSTEYAVIGLGLDGEILSGNEGAQRLYGYEAATVVGQVNFVRLCGPEQLAVNSPSAILQTAHQSGKWAGSLDQIHHNGARFTAQIVILPRPDFSHPLQNYFWTSMG